MQTVFTTVFVDILGFVALVEANEWSLDLLDSFYSSSKTLDEIRTDITPSKYRRPMHPLDAVFSAFHRTLEVNIDRSLRASHLHSIVFSDSAFVAFEHPEIAFDFAQKTMQDSRWRFRFGWESVRVHSGRCDSRRIEATG